MSVIWGFPICFQKGVFQGIPGALETIFLFKAPGILGTRTKGKTSYVYKMSSIGLFCVHYMLIICPSHVYFMSIRWPWNVYYMSVTCPVYVYHMSIICPLRALYVHHMSSVCLLWFSIVCPVCVNYMSVHDMSIICLLLPTTTVTTNMSTYVFKLSLLIYGRAFLYWWG